MQFSNRQLNECLTIMSLIFLEKIRRGAPLAPLEEIRRCSPLITSHLLAQRRNTADEGPLASELLIATFTELGFESSHCKHARYQNSNRNKTGFSGNEAPVFRPDVSRHSSLVTRHFRYEVWLFSAPDATLVTSNRPWQTSPRMTDRPANETCGNEMRMRSKLFAPAAVLLCVALLVSITMLGAPQAGLAARERFVPPVVTAASEIPYPVEVLASGLVTLSLNLGVNGQPPTVQVLRDIPGLTSLTTSTVTGWTYSPGKLDGKPAPSTINIEVVFNPPDALNQNLQMTPVAATTPPAPAGYLPAEVAVGTFAASPRTGPQTGAVVLDVTIDKYGQVKKVDTVRDVPSLTQEAIDTVKRWTINPATFHGKAIASQLVVAFVFRSPTMTTR